MNGPAVRSRKQTPTREQETLVRISKQFNLLCGLTTFVSIEHRAEADRTDGQPATRRVPVTLAKGWGGMEVQSCGGAAGWSAPIPLPAAAPMAAMPRMTIDKTLDMTVDRSVDRSLGKGLDTGATTPRKKSRGLFGKLFGGGGAAPAEPAKPLPAAPSAAAPLGGTSAGTEFYDLARSIDADADKWSGASPADALPPGEVAASAFHDIAGTVQDLLSLQQFDGRFARGGLSIDDLLFSVDGTDWESEVGGALAADHVPASVAGEVTHTIVVLLLLASAFAGDAALWQRAAKKATRVYLAKALGKTSTEAEAWMEALRQRLVDRI